MVKVSAGLASSNTPLRGWQVGIRPCMGTSGVSLYAFITSSNEDTGQIGLVSTKMASFFDNYFFKSPISKCNLKYQG